MEISQPDASEKISTVNGWPYKVCLYGATILNLAFSYQGFIEMGWKSGAIMVAASVLLFVVAPLAWGIGNAVRKFIKPDAYFTHGNSDAFKKKVFWLVGPQWTGFFLAWAAVLFLGQHFAVGAGKNTKITPPVQAAQVMTPADAVPVPVAPAALPATAVPPVLAAPVETPPQVSEKPAPPTAPTAVPETPATPAPSSQNALPATFVVMAPAESQHLLTAMLQQSTSAFKISEIKGKIEALPRPPTGDRKAARKLNDQGLAALKADDFAQALTLLKSAVTTDPADVEVLNNYVYALIKAKRLQDAEAEAGRLLTMSPARSSAWANLAEVYALKNNNQAAVAALILTFQFSSNKDRTVTFLNERAADAGSPLQAVSKTALETIQKM
jgi:Tetratricopeptide repeat